MVDLCIIQDIYYKNKIETAEELFSLLRNADLNKSKTIDYYEFKQMVNI